MFMDACCEDRHQETEGVTFACCIALQRPPYILLKGLTPLRLRYCTYNYNLLHLFRIFLYLAILLRIPFCCYSNFVYIYTIVENECARYLIWYYPVSHLYNILSMLYVIIRVCILWLHVFHMSIFINSIKDKTLLKS